MLNDETWDITNVDVTTFNWSSVLYQTDDDQVQTLLMFYIISQQGLFIIVTTCITTAAMMKGDLATPLLINAVDSSVNGTDISITKNSCPMVTKLKIVNEHLKNDNQTFFYKIESLFKYSQCQKRNEMDLLALHNRGKNNWTNQLINTFNKDIINSSFMYLFRCTFQMGSKI